MGIHEAAKNLTLHGFDVKCFETGDEAAAYICETNKNEIIGFGGSRTLGQLGLYEKLSENNKVWWHVKDPESRRRFPEYTVYMCSANAVSETGELVNIDGTGNRLSASLYGPKRVVFICGKNKLAPDMNAAMERAQNLASPPNAKRLGYKTPCAITGKCHNCNSPERICRSMVIHMRPMKGFEKTEIILINEDLGY